MDRRRNLAEPYHAGRSPRAGDCTEEVLASPRDLPAILLRVWSNRAPRGTSAILEPGTSVDVGSGASSDVRLAEPTLSAVHCRVYHRARSLEVVDLGSRNGLRIAGALVHSAHVLPGSVLSLGEASLEIAVPPAGGAAAASVEPLPGVVGASAPMLALAQRVRRVAPSKLPVLLRGETGTGKELVASALHALSRRPGPFVAINAGAISSSLAESELFGHLRGAFTGAIVDRRGAFLQADRGTLLLDEVGSLPRDMQAKLLRVLEDGAVRALGAERSAQVDVRVIAATCEPLERLVESGRFRQDLYERLSACVVRLPPLRERRADLPSLCSALCSALGLDGSEPSQAALQLLETLPLRGNVRELKNLLGHASVLAGPGTPIEPEHLREAILEREGPRQQLPDAAILHAYDVTGCNASATARALGIPRTTVRDAIKRARDRWRAPAD
ncbi:MAG: sigma 54-interacting transcriptional regulator [Myxococcales bacterium]|nr:sigma 54-interacting transcriptional regulator [Myxococcales bacterium]